MKQLTPLDALFVYNEKQVTPFHISPVLIYNPPEPGQPPVRFREILKRFEERIDQSPIFVQKLVRVPLDLDAPYWINDSEFDVEFHVRHIALPKPGDWRQFCILLARLHSRPLDMSRPPWEAYVIEGLDNINGLPEGSFAMYMKIHHSAGDGSTLNQLVEVLHDSVPNPEPTPAPKKVPGEAKPSDLNLLGRAYINALSYPLKALDLTKLFTTSSNAREISQIENDSPDHRVSTKLRFNDNIPSAHRIFGGLRMELDEVKRIKRAVGDCTLNDVLLGIVSGALREYLAETDELPEGSLVTAVPISTRDPSEVSSEGGNKISAMRILLRTDIEDPLERIKLINQDALSSKAYANAVGIEQMSTIIDSIPASLASWGMRVVAETGLASRTAFAHTAVTNVPGPQSPFYLCGAQASLWIGVAALLDGSGLVHTINSYNGRVFISFLSCREMMEDPEVYHRCLNRSFQNALQAAESVQKKTKAKSA